MESKSFSILILSLLIGIILLIGINFSIGYAPVTLRSFFSSEDAYHSIAQLRLYRVISMVLVGISVPTAGFILQEYFQNPLAGPSVLGISSVSSLSVALFIFSFRYISIPQFVQLGGISIMAIFGSLLAMLIILSFAKKSRDASYLIIIGFLISALSGAIISLLQLYSDNQELRSYILWSFGANILLNAQQVTLLSILVTMGIVCSFFTIKPLMGSVLGSSYTHSFGIDMQRLRWLVILSSSILTAGITAFLGPILFVGIIIPHLSRLVYNPAKLWHQWLLNIMIGTITMQFFSIISEYFLLPLNIITSLIGIPIIFLMMIRK